MALITYFPCQRVSGRIVRQKPSKPMVVVLPRLAPRILLVLLALGLSPVLARNAAMPDFSGITRWLNTPKPLTAQDLKGKVVLIDFWTYSCINCIRSTPHLKVLYEKY